MMKTEKEEVNKDKNQWFENIKQNLHTTGIHKIEYHEKNFIVMSLNVLKSYVKYIFQI